MVSQISLLVPPNTPIQSVKLAIAPSQLRVPLSIVFRQVVLSAPVIPAMFLPTRTSQDDRPVIFAALNTPDAVQSCWPSAVQAAGTLYVPVIPAIFTPEAMLDANIFDTSADLNASVVWQPTTPSWEQDVTAGVAGQVLEELLAAVDELLVLDEVFEQVEVLEHTFVPVLSTPFAS